MANEEISITEDEMSLAQDEMPLPIDDVKQGIAQDGNPAYFVRLNLNERVQHLIFLTSFVMLAFTGLMVWLPEKMFHFLGSAKESVFFVRGILHRVFATTMILVCIYHLYYLIFKSAGRRWLMDMMPRIRDITDFFYYMLYLIGLKDEPPEFDRFSYKHKMEYGALIAGTTLMSTSGIILWSEYYWDKFIVDIAALVHGMEAVLACLAVMIWHLYEVHLRPHKFPIDNMWLTGIIDEAEMKAEYPLHYKKIMSNPELQKIYMRKGSQQNG
jgi:cytochrome b subunit of formate dehydrogenase